MFVKSVAGTIAKAWRYGAFGLGLVGVAWHCEKERWNGSLLTSRTSVIAKCVENRHGDGKKFRKAIDEARKCAEHIQIQSGSPGLVVAVSVNGELVWSEGFGYADVENRVRCKPETVLRVASISKSMTAGLLATMIEDGVVDLDADIRQYVDFPAKTWKGEEMRITTRMLVSHLGGIRHYEKEEEKEKGKKEEDGEGKGKEEGKVKSESAPVEKLVAEPTTPSKVAAKEGAPSVEKKNSPPIKSQFDNEEYFIKDRFDSITSSLSIFKDDPLAAEPGKTFLYTTHGWTLISAVIEAAAKSKAAPSNESLGGEGKKKSPSSPTFVKLMTAFFKRLDLRETRCEENDPLIPNRARHYRRNKLNKLENVPYVDNSYKWAGGGFLSTIKDLIKFGNANLYAFQSSRKASVVTATSGEEGEEGDDEGFCEGNEETVSPSAAPGYVSRRTMRALWTPAPHTLCPWAKEEPGNGYGVGWGVVQSSEAIGGPNPKGGLRTPTYVSHTGGAVGASSVLLIIPGDRGGEERVADPYEGVVVAMIANLQEVGLYKTAVQIADLFIDA